MENKHFWPVGASHSRCTNRHFVEQQTQCEKTNKGNYHFKMTRPLFVLLFQCVLRFPCCPAGRFFITCMTSCEGSIPYKPLNLSTQPWPRFGAFILLINLAENFQRSLILILWLSQVLDWLLLFTLKQYPRCRCQFCGPYCFSLC